MSTLPVVAPADRRAPVVAAGLGLTILAILAVAAVFAPAVILHGWLIAFASVAGVALGCVAWLAIHALTGGRWGEVGAPALRRGALLLPASLILILPLIVAGRWLYPWAAAPDNAAAPDVGRLYLNEAGVALRSALLLGGLSVAAWLARRGPLRPVAAAIALLIYGGLMNLMAFDWLLSLDPRYTSSAIGMQTIVAQLLSALCAVVLITDAPAEDAVWGDYGSLMLACLLGEAYLLLMTLVVHWYGNLPEQAAWYLARSGGGWRWFDVVGVLFGAVGPAVALLFSRVRHARTPLRYVAAAILAGVGAENIWIVAPSAGPAAGWAAVAGLAATVGCGLLLGSLSLRLRFAAEP